MDYIVTTRKKLPRNRYGDIYTSSSVSTVISGGSSSGGSSGGGTNYSNFTPATAEAAGRAGLVPAPQQGSNLSSTYLLNALGVFTNYEVLSAITYSDSSVRPTSDSTYNIGSSSYIFKTGYISRWQPTSDSTKYIEYDSGNGAFKVNGSIYATGNVAAGGFSNTSGSGTGGGGSDIDVYTASSLSTNASAFSSSSTSNTFNAYTINYLHRRLNSIENGNVNVNMSDYVKKTELSQQSYITSSSLNTTLGDYITKTVLSNQSYVTASQLSNQSYVTATQLSNQSYVTNTALGNTLSSYVTKTQLSAQSYLVKTGDTMTGNLTMASGKKIIFNSSPASYIQYDSSNNALMVYGSIYATGNVAAGGYSGTSGSSSGGGDITITNGSAESGKYISGLSASGNTITVTKATLPSGGTSGDTNTWRGISVDGTSFKTTAITSGNVNFVAGSNVTLTTSGNNITIAATGGSSTSGDYLPLSGGTVNGDVRLYKPSANYGVGAKLNFGDSDYSYITEDTDDHLTIYASKGLSIAVGSGYSVDIPGFEGGGGSEWYNIRTEREATGTGTSKVWTLHTIIENFSGSPLETEKGNSSYVNGTKYRLCIMTFRKHKGTGRSWRIPMFSKYWDWDNLSNKAQTSAPSLNSNNHHAQDWEWKHTWWTVNGNDNIWFDNRHLVSSSSRPKLLYSSTTSSNRNCIIDDRIYSSSYTTRKVVLYSSNPDKYRWRGLKNKKRKVGVALFKYTGDGTFGWQRVSNISYVELFVNDKAEVHTNVII